MKRNALLRSTAIAGACVFVLAGAAKADKIQFYPINTDPSAWDADRTPEPPFVLLDSYMGRSNVLALEVVPGNAFPDSFNRWEGYSQRTTMPAGDSFIGGDVWIADGWQTGDDTYYVRTSMWGSAMTDAETAENGQGDYNDADAVFPIIQFTNRGGTGRLEVWDPSASPVEGWVDLPETEKLISYAGWNTIDMRLLTDVDAEGKSAIQYYFNGNLIYTWDDPVSRLDTSPEQFYAMYLKARNNAAMAYTTYWSRLLSGLLLPEDVEEIGNSPSDVLVVNNNGPVFVTQGAVIGGTLSVRGGPDQQQVIGFQSNTTVKQDLVLSNAVAQFTQGDQTPVTIGGDLDLQNGSQTGGGTRGAPFQVSGNGNIDISSVLAGNGRFGLSLFSQGYIMPGNSIGTISVGGNLVLAPTSVYAVEVDLSGDADLIEVGGVANLDGVVTVDAIDGYLLDYDYVILTAAGGLNGTEFASSTPAWNNINNYAFVEPVLSYDPNTVYLTLQRNSVPLSSFAMTPNQVATADALDTLGALAQPPALYNALLSQLTAADAPAVFDALSGEIYASNDTVMIDQTQYVRDAVYGRLQQAFGGKSMSTVQSMSYAPAENMADPYDMGGQGTFGAWGYAYGGWGDYDGDSNTGSLNASSGGFLAGIDGSVADDWRVGVLAGYGYTSFDNKGPASGDTEAYTIGAYTGGAFGGDSAGAWAVRAGLAYTWNTTSTTRVVSFPGFYDDPGSDYDSGAFQMFGELAYSYAAGEELDIEPYVNLAYVNLNSGSFSETGATAAALAVQSDSMNTYFSTLGIRAATEFDLGHGMSEAYFDIGWRHAFGDVDPTSTAAFVGSSPFTVEGVPLAEDTAMIGAGIDFALSRQATLGIGYIGQFGSSVTQNSVTAKLDISF